MTDLIKETSNVPLCQMDLDSKWRMCKILCASKILPRSYDTPEKVIAGLQYATELGLEARPLMALRNISIINGTPSIWGDLPLALVYKSGELLSIDEFFANEKGERLPPTTETKLIYSANCKVQRKGFEERSFSFTIEDMNKISNSTNQVWRTYTKIMMKRKARALALKDVFPDIMLGVSIGEYEYSQPFPMVEEKQESKELDITDFKEKHEYEVEGKSDRESDITVS